MLSLASNLTFTCLVLTSFFHYDLSLHGKFRRHYYTGFRYFVSFESIHVFFLLNNIRDLSIYQKRLNEYDVYECIARLIIILNAVN